MAPSMLKLAALVLLISISSIIGAPTPQLRPALINRDAIAPSELAVSASSKFTVTRDINERDPQVDFGIGGGDLGLTRGGVDRREPSPEPQVNFGVGGGDLGLTRGGVGKKDTVAVVEPENN